METATTHELKTAFTESTVKVIIRNMTHATVTFENLGINRTINSGNMQLVRTVNGWDLWNHHQDGDRPSVTPHERLYKALYVGSRWDGAKFIEPTQATRSKIVEKLLPIALQFLAANPELLRAAERLKLQSGRDEAIQDIMDLERQITAKRAEVDRFQLRLNELESVEL